MRVLVTGAAGFVGRAVVARLAGADHQVLGAVRAPRQSDLPNVGYIATGDIGDADWTPALDGVEAVVHLAARVHVMRDTVADPLAAFRAVNVAATERLAEAAAAAGVRRFVFISSIKAMLDHGAERAITIADPAVPTTPYGVSKLEAEQVVARVADAAGMEAVTFRPPLIYGPGVKGNFRALMRACDRGFPMPLGGIRNKRSILFVDNFADAIAAALSAPGVASGTYLLQDDTVSVTEMVESIGRALGRRPRLVTMPKAAVGLLRRILRTAPVIERLTESLHVGDAPFRAAAGWAPPVGRDAAFAATARAYRQEASG